MITFRYVKVWIALLGCTLASALAADSVKEWAPQSVIYKQTDQGDLRLHIFDNQTGHSPRPAVVFFFGGGWIDGTPNQFFRQCRYLAEKGMVAVSAEYRTQKQHGTTPFECVKDGKSAIRWVRSHARQWDIDPNQIVAGGGSAGGHVAACTALIQGMEEEGEDLTISSVPNALVLFNPVIDTSPLGYGNDRLADQWKKISPLHHIRKGSCPTIIFHGTADRTVSIERVRLFKENMEKQGNICTVVEYEEMGHGFFNKSKMCYETIQKVVAFLISHSM